MQITWCLLEWNEVVGAARASLVGTISAEQMPAWQVGDVRDTGEGSQHGFGMGIIWKSKDVGTGQHHFLPRSSKCRVPSGLHFSHLGVC